MHDAPSQSIGHLALIGAGPGDPELITVKGLRLLHAADVILFDRLAPRQLLDENPRAEKIDVGKFPGRPTPSQPWINDLIVQHAQQGKRVVRLKGGDPFVFGRGGEEIIAAVEAHIPFEIVPGVTSGLALPAMCGVPATHRGISRAVALVTAVTDWDHPANSPAAAGEAESQIDQVAHVDTICIYMGRSQIDVIARRLIDLGRDAHTPVMSISAGCTPREKLVVSTLEHIAADVAAAELQSPVLTIVGDVVSLRDRLSAERAEVAP